MTSARAATLGLAAGLRTFTPLAALSLQPHCWRRLRRYLVVAALIELGLDKLPRTPSRLGPLPLGARLLSGATAAVASEGPCAVPAGMLSALIGAHVGAGLRRRAVEDIGWPDYIAAGLEDALAVTMATLAAQRDGRSDSAIPAGDRLASIAGRTRRENVRPFGFDRAGRDERSGTP